MDSPFPASPYDDTEALALQDDPLIRRPEPVAIVKSYQLPPLKAPAFYTYHTACFRATMVGALETIDEGMQHLLVTGTLPLIGGQARVVPISDLAVNCSCVVCHIPISEE